MDYVLLAIMLSGSMGIGLYFAFSGGRQRTKVEYLLAERRMSALPVCMSLFATFQSAIALLGVPTEIYRYGTMQVYNIVAMFLSQIIGMVTVIPLFYPLKITSIYEYLKLRFESRVVQLFGAAVGVVSSISYMTIALLTPALALETAVSIPLWLSIVLIGVVGTVYTTLGGMKSVIWTDVFQTFVMFLGIFTVLVKGSMDAGGPEEVWTIGKATGRIEMDATSLDPRTRHTVWNLCFGSLFYWLSTHFSQSSVQRIVSIKSMKDANKVFIFTIPITAIFISVNAATGLVLTAYFYGIGCDPLEAGYIKNQNQLVPFFVLHTLRSLPGVAGLYISTVFSGALSTLSSGINSLAANAVEDFLSKPLERRSEKMILTVTKLFVFMFGAVVIGLAFLAKEFQGPVTQMTYTCLGATNGPLMGLFVLGATSAQANSIGALAGCSSGLLCSLWLAVGSFLYGYPAKTLEPGSTINCSASDSVEDLPSSTSSLLMYPDNDSLTRYLANTTLSSTRSLEDTGLWIPPEHRVFSIYDLSYVWNPLIGMLVTVVVGFIMSIISNHFLAKKPNPEPKLIFPFCRPCSKSRVYALETEHQMETIGKA
ncbi:sodium-coupled monocarboxylate transporter 1 [Elysia marginata]|uniref:Sodium-coupled monocarboxylate transporter 1 n=1 Tax=Elysia marginata TaxID=1093978 RepID=A0AAV4JQD8_9GAST|nr:sodium-coupled monocarboxylate transporter 1 [Elysia marginata]